MNILVTGSSGLIGSALVEHFTGRSQHVTRLVRRMPRQGAAEIYWNPDSGGIDAASLEGIEAVVHLAGGNLAAGRWNQTRKSIILASRVSSTELLTRTLVSLKRPPEVMISASAVGYYGNRGDEILTEESGPGAGFLAEVCRRWERAAMGAEAGGIRLIVLRLGMVLTRAGGALPRMLTPFRLGIGGRLGAGTQYMGWLVLDDLMEIISFALSSPSLSGAINAVAPNPVTNREFTKILSRVLSRPALFSVPAFAIRMMFGEMGEQLLLAGARVEPVRLIRAGYRFRYPELEPALRYVLSA